jgi:hypothetical protein
MGMRNSVGTALLRILSGNEKVARVQFPEILLTEIQNIGPPSNCGAQI